MADVLVVGAGPVGLTLAGELARHGARCRIVERMAAPSPFCRAIGVTPRTLEVWEDMGVAREMADAGLWLTGMRSVVAGRPPVEMELDASALPYGHLGIPQYETERVLERHLGRFGVSVERGVSLQAVADEGEAVAVRLARPDAEAETARFRFVVGCDGAHSAVRHAAGIAFDGEAIPLTFMLGDVHVDWDLPYGRSLRALRLREGGPPDVFIAIPLPERGRYRVSSVAPPGLTAGATAHGIQAEARGPGLAELQAVADALLPDRAALSDLRWSSLFRISMRLAARYRAGRLFIAGDAAHIHPPTGGQGMNTGIQDAYNLAWKLALVLAGAAPDTLLDSYEAERRPVGADVVARTRAATLAFGREPAGAPREDTTQISVSYRGRSSVRDDGGALGERGLAAGDRAPDVQGLRRRGYGFPVRLFELLRGTEHVLVAGLADGAAFRALAAAARAWRGRCGGRFRAIGVGPAAAGWDEEPGVTLVRDGAGDFARAYGADAAFLVRPDGYIGWCGPSWREAGLAAYLDAVFA